MISDQIKRGKELMKKGDSCLKTSLLKWSADPQEASIYYQEAGELFRDNNDPYDAKIAFKKYAECSEKVNSYHGAAKGLTEAAKLEENFEEKMFMFN
jgi:hypothetical protein